MRICLSSGRWSGRKPVCRSKYPICHVVTLIKHTPFLADGSIQTLTFTYSNKTYTISAMLGRIFFTKMCTNLQLMTHHDSSVHYFNDYHFNIVTDCGSPKPPVNGFVDYSRSTFRSEATYTCKPGHHLIGDKVRHCEITGSWSGTIPTCQGKHPCCYSVYLV